MRSNQDPDAASFARLIDGVRRFRADIYPGQAGRFQALATVQTPHTLFIVCTDSRVMPEMLTQAEPGELFVCRNIGNIVPAHGAMPGGVSAIVEYAVMALGVARVVLCGHSDCGAMKALLDLESPALRRMPGVADWLRNAEAARSVVDVTHPHAQGAEKIQALVEQNVRTQLGHLRTHPAVAARVAEGSLALHGWVYGIEGGSIADVNEATGQVTPLASRRDVPA